MPICHHGQIAGNEMADKMISKNKNSGLLQRGPTPGQGTCDVSWPSFRVKSDKYTRFVTKSRKG